MSIAPLRVSPRNRLPRMQHIPGRLAVGDPVLCAAIPLILVAMLAVVAERSWRVLHPALPAARNLSSRVSLDSDLRGGESSGPSPNLSRVFTPQVLFWQNSILRWADAYRLDPDLVATLIQIESCGDPRAVSSAGALGLFQVMPFHFSPGEDPMNPEDNARRGLSYLARALEMASGDFSRALAGYNGGHGVIAQDPYTWPTETRRYVAWGASILSDAQSGVPSSPTLQEWLAAGGDQLCQNAANWMEESTATASN